MTRMKQMTERRQRFNHLIGVDRYRVVFRFGDGSVQTQSFDERTEDRAKAAAAANLAPAGWERPVSIEILLGQFNAVGPTDCEWRDTRRLAAGAPEVGTGIVWQATDEPVQPAGGAGGQLGLFEGGNGS